MRHIPIFTFINKMDREANDPFELLDEIESVLELLHAQLTGLSAAVRNSRAYMTVKRKMFLYSRQP